MTSEPAIKASPLADKYERTVDRESAYEVLTGRAGSGQLAHEEAAPAPQPGRRGQYDATPPPTADTPPASGPWGRSRIPQTEPAPPKPKPRLREAQPAPPPPPPREPKAPARRGDTLSEAMMKSAGRTVANVVVREATKAIMRNGRSILRGVLGSLVK